MPADPVDVVRLGYDALGERYRSWSASSGVRERLLGPLLARLAAGSRVVDLGCGPGEPAARLLSAHHRVLGVDLSRAQLDLARRAAPGATFVLADMTRFALRAGSVDAVVCLYALGHVPAAAQRPLLGVMAEWLRPGGVLLANAPTGAGAAFEADWLGVPMFFDGLGAEGTLAAVASAGLRVEAAERVDEGAGGEFVWLTATRPAGGR